MGKIFYVMGKSASGKDTLYKRIKEQAPRLKTVVPYTTRPIREGETKGGEYHFTTAEALERFRAQGKVVELRTYHTACGPWSYATVDDGQIDLEAFDYLMIGTLESYRSTKAHFGEGALVPLYIETEDGERLSRALARERAEGEPKYAELCRRFLADEEDFCEEKLREAGITVRYENSGLEDCLDRILEKIDREAPANVRFRNQ